MYTSVYDSARINAEHIATQQACKVFWKGLAGHNTTWCRVRHRSLIAADHWSIKCWLQHARIISAETMDVRNLSHCNLINLNSSSLQSNLIFDWELYIRRSTDNLVTHKVWKAVKYNHGDILYCVMEILYLLVNTITSPPPTAYETCQNVKWNLDFKHTHAPTHTWQCCILFTHYIVFT